MYERRLREAAARQLAEAAARREPEGPPRSDCGDCVARIFLVGRALVDGLCRLCREQAEGPAEVVDAPELSGPVTCSGWDGVLCDWPALPTRHVCARHRAQELAAEPEAC